MFTRLTPALAQFREFRAVFQALEVLYAPATAAEYPQRVLASIGTLFPSCSLSYGEMNFTTGQLDTVRNYATPLPAKEFDRLQEEVIRDNPIVNYVEKGGTERVVTISDLITLRQFKRTRLYNELMRPCALTHHISALVPKPGFAVGLGINSDRDCTETHRVILQLMSPHIAQASRNAELYSNLARVECIGDFTPLLRLGLSQRQCEVLYWLVQGKRDKEIASLLSLSARTVHHHVADILDKLGVKTRSAAAALAASLSQDGADR